MTGMLGSDGGLQENEFGYRKRMAEAGVRTSGLEAVIVRAAILDQLRLEEGLQVLTLTLTLTFTLTLLVP